MNARIKRLARAMSLSLCVAVTLAGCRATLPEYPVADFQRRSSHNLSSQHLDTVLPTAQPASDTRTESPNRPSINLISLKNPGNNPVTPDQPVRPPDTLSASDILLADFYVGPVSDSPADLDFADLLDPAQPDFEDDSTQLAQAVDAAVTLDPPASNTGDDSPQFSDNYETVKPSESQHPIDLPSALRLAGADNWSIRLAHERIHEAQADLAEAEAMWLPSINLGIGYTQHEGKIQGTDGNVIDSSRNSLFLGGGAVDQNAPMAGGAGGPSRLQVDLSLTDALYEPLARCQRVNAAKARQTTVFNETLTSVALAYYELIGAQGRLSLENQNIKDANDVLHLTEAFAAAGKAPRSEMNRVSVAAGIREQAAIQAELTIKSTSAELARLLQLDFRQLPSGFVLVSNESQPTPVDWVDKNADLQSLIAQGLGVRPEVHELQASVSELNCRIEAEQVRPFVPHLHLGLSGGLFSGGTGADPAVTGGRSDMDALLVWQMKNLGYGNRAALAQRVSQQRQAVIRSHRIEDLIAAEITQAWQTVQARRESIHLAQENIEQASAVYASNLLRIRGLEGLPLEALQALQALAAARVALLDAIVDYNKAQVLLLKAIGRPIDGSSLPAAGN